MAHCEACGAEKSFGTPLDGVRYACGAYRIGKSGLVRSRGCLENEVTELREFKRLVVLANKLPTTAETSIAIRRLFR